MKSKQASKKALFTKTVKSTWNHQRLFSSFHGCLWRKKNISTDHSI